MANERIEINTFDGQQKKIKRIVAGDNINLKFDAEENLIISAQGGSGGTDIEVMQIVPDTNLQVLYADGLATFSGMVANLKNGDNPVSVPAEIELPIKAGDNVTIDASEDDKYLIVKSTNGSNIIHKMTATENTIKETLYNLYNNKTIIRIDATVNFTNNSTLNIMDISGSGSIDFSNLEVSFSDKYLNNGVASSANQIAFHDLPNDEIISLSLTGNDTDVTKCLISTQQSSMSNNQFRVSSSQTDTNLTNSTFTIYYCDPEPVNF